MVFVSTVASERGSCLEVEQHPKKRLSDGRQVLRRVSMQRLNDHVTVMGANKYVGSPAQVNFMSIQDFLQIL